MQVRGEQQPLKFLNIEGYSDQLFVITEKYLVCWLKVGKVNENFFFKTESCLDIYEVLNSKVASV